MLINNKDNLPLFNLYIVNPMTLGSTAVCWFSDTITSSLSLMLIKSCGLMWNESWFLQPPAVTPLLHWPWYIFMCHCFLLSDSDDSSLAVSVSRCMHSKIVKLWVNETNDIQNSPISNCPSNRSRSCIETLSQVLDIADQSPQYPYFDPNASHSKGSCSLTNCTESPRIVSTLSKEQSL